MTNPQIERIRALLVKAARTESTAEATALNNKATELIARYGVDALHLAASGAVADDIREELVTVHNPYRPQRVALLTSVTDALRCLVVTNSATKTVRVFGYGSDIDRALMLYRSLLTQSDRAVMAAKIPKKTGTIIFRRSFWRAYTSTVYARLLEAENKAARTSHAEMNAVMVRDRRIAVAEFVTNLIGHADLIPHKPVSRVGYAAGVAAGRQADIGGAKLSQGTHKAIGW